jgi:hypothetical protein
MVPDVTRIGQLGVALSSFLNAIVRHSTSLSKKMHDVARGVPMPRAFRSLLQLNGPVRGLS